MPALLRSGTSIELISHPGRGKSTFIKDMVKIMSDMDGQEWGFATMFLATQTPPDLIGYQFKGEREWGGKKVTVTDPSVPLWMITHTGKPTWEYERGILFLDEYGQGEADVKRASEIGRASCRERVSVPV
jgi:energy-coupling factor transporter ATP-binding protein EcfA2